MEGWTGCGLDWMKLQKMAADFCCMFQGGVKSPESSL